MEVLELPGTLSETINKLDPMRIPISEDEMGVVREVYSSFHERTEAKFYCRDPWAIGELMTYGKFKELYPKCSQENQPTHRYKVK